MGSVSAWPDRHSRRNCTTSAAPTAVFQLTIVSRRDDGTWTRVPLATNAGPTPCRQRSSDCRSERTVGANHARPSGLAGVRGASR